MDETPDFDREVAPEEIILPEVTSEGDTLFEIAAFIADSSEEEARMAMRVEDKLDELYEGEESPEEIATLILSYLQDRHGWALEIVATKQEVEEDLMRTFSRYDEDIWGKVVGTESFRDLHQSVYVISRNHIHDAISEVVEGDNPRYEGLENDGTDHPEFTGYKPEYDEPF